MSPKVQVMSSGNDPGSQGIVQVAEQAAPFIEYLGKMVGVPGWKQLAREQTWSVGVAR